MKKINLNSRKVGLIFVMLIMFSSFVLAGPGVKWSRESALVEGGSKDCMTYSVYNPWPRDSFFKISLSEDFEDFKIFNKIDEQFVPQNTMSVDAIPVEFCFKTPKICEYDCWLFDKFICEQNCPEERKEFTGKVVVNEVSDPALSGGGSATRMSVSAPLTVRVDCVPRSRNYSLIYIFVVLIATVLLVINLVKNKKNKSG